MELSRAYQTASEEVAAVLRRINARSTYAFRNLRQGADPTCDLGWCLFGWNGQAYEGGMFSCEHLDASVLGALLRRHDALGAVDITEASVFLKPLMYMADAIVNKKGMPAAPLIAYNWMVGTPFFQQGAMISMIAATTTNHHHFSFPLLLPLQASTTFTSFATLPSSHVQSRELFI